jgi:hypothetical protein
MLAAARTPKRDRIAIGGSIAIHVCVLLLVLATYPRATFPTDDPDERTLFASIIRLERRPPPVVAVHPRATLAQPASAPALPIIRAAVATGHSSRQLVVARERRAPSVEAQLSAQHRSVKPPLIAMQQRVFPTAAPAAQTATTPAPPAPPAPSPVVAQREEGIGNFGETYPAAIDPALRGALFAGVNGVLVRITVDENGHPTSIEFLRAPSDAAQREELRSRILASHFTPASCNGLRCAGSLELKN